MQVVDVRVFSRLKSSLLSLMSVRHSDGMTETADRLVSAATVPVKFHPQATRGGSSASPILRTATRKLLERYSKRIYLV